MQNALFVDTILNICKPGLQIWIMSKRFKKNNNNKNLRRTLVVNSHPPLSLKLVDLNFFFKRKADCVCIIMMS